MNWVPEAARWYAVLLVATWGLAPIAHFLLGHLADRGASAARAVALLGVVFPLWLLSSLSPVPYSTAGLWLSMAMLSVLSWGLLLSRGRPDKGWLRGLMVAELLSLSVFLAYLWLRGFTPAADSTEKPMDAALLAASQRAVEMPPPDPWFAGEPINYYYLGYLIHGTVGRLAVVASSVAHNLALVTTFSTTVVAVGGLAFNASRGRLSARRSGIAALLAAFLVMVGGNLYGAREFLADPGETWSQGWWEGIGWNASRVIVDYRIVGNERVPGTVIDEFPFFSFLLGDNHPHVMSLPFTTLALSIAFAFATLGSRRARLAAGRDAWVYFGIAAVALGALYPLNSWDYPTFLVIALAALWFGSPTLAPGFRLVAGLGTVAVSVLAWSPFWVRFVPLLAGSPEQLAEGLRDIPVLTRILTTIGAVEWERTSTGEFLTMFGLPYVFAIWLIGGRLGLLVPRRPSRAWAQRVGIGALVLFGVAVATPAPVVLLCGVPLVAALALLQRDRAPTPRNAATMLYAAGFGLILVCEFFYLRDSFGASRMNTVFKAYYQVWLLFGIATALTTVELWREARPRWAARPALFGAVAVAIVAASVYPVIASYRWTGEFARWRGLDGLAHVEDAFPDEAAAIRWLRANADEDDVLLEASSRCTYNSLFARFATFTGVPTVIGWTGHEGQWRSGQPELAAQIEPRRADVATMYERADAALLDQYGVTLLVVGNLERGEGVSRDCLVPPAPPYEVGDFSALTGAGWSTVFDQGDVAILRRSA